MLEVQEVSTGIGSVCEEVAVLYANGNVREAEALLDALLADPAHADNEWPWMMLLDLYRLSGQRERFEQRVIEFATRFERSPPPWRDLAAAAPRRAQGGAAPALNLGTSLTAAQGRPIEQLVIIGEKSGAIRIDLQSVRSADDEGCTLLLEAIERLRRARVKVSLGKADRLADALSARLPVGTAQSRPAWLLLLELLQHCGDQERFEQRALDYAITFEESPPSWAPVQELPEAAQPRAERAAEPAGDLAFEGEITGGGSAVIGQLVTASEQRSALEVDCSRLRRMDFVSAGTLFNVLSTLQGQGCKVTLREVNAMVLALLHVMGVGQIARVIPRA